MTCKWGMRLSLSPLRNQEGKLGDVKDGGVEVRLGKVSTLFTSQCIQPHLPVSSAVLLAVCLTPWVLWAHRAVSRASGAEEEKESVMLIGVECPILMGALAETCSRPRGEVQQSIFWVRGNPVPEAYPRKDRSRIQRQTDKEELRREREKQSPGLFLHLEGKSKAGPWIFWDVEPESLNN